MLEFRRPPLNLEANATCLNLKRFLLSLMLDVPVVSQNADRQPGEHTNRNQRDDRHKDEKLM